jgi:hypothetical protein
MNASQFREKMEAFAKLRNIPLHDVLSDIDEIGVYALTKTESERNDYFQRAFIVYCQGFPDALPPGTTSLRRREAELADD